MKNGFTLIEMLIGLAILAILLALGAPSFSEMLVNSRIRSSAESAASMLQLARAEAIKRNRDIYFGVVGGELGSASWNPVFGTADGNLAVFADNGGGNWELIDSRSNGEGGSTGSAYRAASTDKAVTGANEQGVVVFNSIGRTRSAAGGAFLQNAVFEFQTPRGSAECIASALDANNQNGGGRYRCLRVVVSPSGSIRMCDPSVTTARDTRAC